MRLSEAIRNTRKKALISQKSFAKEINVSSATVNRWEVGKSKPNINAMNSLKAFCEKRALPFECIETAWMNDDSQPGKEI